MSHLGDGGGALSIGFRFRLRWFMPDPLYQSWKVHSFADFWPLYLAEHRRPLTRQMHVAGTLSAMLLLLASLFGGPGLALVGIGVGYALAWLAHFQVEGNRPATFSHPWWSLLGDLRMTALFLSRRLDGELKRFGL